MKLRSRGASKKQSDKGLDRQLEQSNKRKGRKRAADGDPIKLIEEVKEVEEKIDTNPKKRNRKGKNEESKSPAKNRRSTSKRGRSNSPEAPKFKKAEDGRRVVSKRGAGGKKKAKSAAKEKPASEDQELTEKERLKLERQKLREEKKKERERKKLLKSINPNPDVEKIEINPILEPTYSKKLEKFPLEGCSKFSDNRKFLFLYNQAETNKQALKELENLILKDQSLANPFQYYSVHVKKSIMDLAIKRGDADMVKILLKENDRMNKPSCKRPTLPTSSLSSVGTGMFNKYQFGFFTRPVMLGRGGKEGNNAFTHDNSLIGNTRYEMTDIAHLLEQDLTWEVFQSFILTKLYTEADLWDYLWILIRRGNVDFLRSKIKKDGPTLLERLFNNCGYGFNRYHHIALEDDVEGRINKMSMLKKPHTNKGICPLHVACINPNITVLRKFYTTNPDYSAADLDQRKLMHYAAANVSDVALQFLVSKSIPINDKDLRGVTPLMIACELGRTDNVKLILKEQKRQLEDLDQEDEDYQLMLKSSDFINNYGPNHQFPIHYAVNSGSIETVKALVEGASDTIDLEVRTTDGKSPLSIACCQGFYDIAKYLLSKGVQVYETKKQKKNPLIWAAQNGHIHIVSLLLRHGIHPDLADSSGNTAAHYAAGYGWLNVLKFLIENGAHPDLKNDWNSTPAMIAMLKNHFGCLDYLMEIEGVDKSMVDNEGRSVISQLCMNFTKDTLDQIKYMDKFKQLDYNSKDANGYTCMHFLVANGIDYNQITTEINKRLTKMKSELLKKTGNKNGNDSEQDMEEDVQPISRKRSRGGKKQARMKKAMPTAKLLMPKTTFAGNLYAGNDGAEQSESDDENPNNFVTYYQPHKPKHRKLYSEVRAEMEDHIIECAKHLVKQGFKEDSVAYDGNSTVKLALNVSNTRVAVWLVNNICDGEFSEDIFKEEESTNAYRYGTQQLSFLFKLPILSDGVDWEPIIELMIKRAKKEQVLQLMQQTNAGENALVYLFKNSERNSYRNDDKMSAYIEEKFLKNMDLLIKLASFCDYEIGSTIKYSRYNAYNYQTQSYPPQEDLDKHFETFNEEKLDEKVNEYGLIDLNLNETDLLYFDNDPSMNVYCCQNVKSNLLHAMIRQTNDESDLLY
jgi:ankyrin repeat protein